MKNQKRTTIYDIARKLNLNASSVSRALSNTSKVSEATRKLILDTAREMNYQPNSLASNLRRGSNRTIGVIVPRINQNFFADIIAGLEEITYENGYNLVICQSNESYKREVECVNTLINQQVNCIVMSVAAEFEDDAHIRNIQKNGIRLIQFDRVADELDTLKVLNDNRQASVEAVSHLVEQGYRRIALLEGPQNLNIFRQRKEGYLQALAEHGIEVRPELMKVNAWTQELSAEATRELLALPDPPDAIFASTSDFSALGVLQVATELGLKVPDQLGICGYSNEAFTEITSPSITTIDQHSVEMGNAIARLYFREAKLDAIASGPKTIHIKPQLIIRESSCRRKF